MRSGFTLLSALALAACQQPTQEQTTTPEPEPRDSVPAQSSDSVSPGTPIAVPSDPRAQYYLLSKSTMANGNLEVVTRRVGPSGESFARREVNCPSGTVRYIGEGDTQAEAEADAPNTGEMTAPIAESITGVITKFVCA